MKKIEGLDCIFLIDDDQSTNFLHEMIIEDFGLDVKVQSFTSGQEGLDYLMGIGKYSNKAEYPKPGIIFLDINMPGMNGWEFLEKYHELPLENKSKVIVAMLTTSLNPRDKEKGEKIADVKTFINKPLSEETLQNIIDKYYS